MDGRCRRSRGENRWRPALWSDEELVAAIRQLTEDRALRDRLGALARAGYEAHYTRDKHVADYLSHVDDVLGKRD